MLLSDGRQLPADLVVVAIGVEPNTALAVDAGLEVDNGIVVDRRLRAGDDYISAIGDCANFPDLAGRRARLESVQNAVEQARENASQNQRGRICRLRCGCVRWV